MKNIKYMLILAVSLLMASCTLNKEKTCLGSQEDFVAPVLNPMADVLSDANTSSVEQVVFTWSDADFGADVAVLYSLYATKGDKKALVGQSFTTSFAIAKGDLVGVVFNELGGAKNELVGVESYLEATVDGADVVTPVVSNKVSYGVFTYLPAKKQIWLPGAYQGWAQLGTTVWEYAAGTSQYKFLVNVSDGGEGPYYFKVVDEGQNWVGMNDGYKPSGWEVADPKQSDGNFSVTKDEPILYLTIDTKKKTVAKETVTKVAMIGGFNEWSDATEPEFTYDAAENVWVSPVIAFDGSGWLVRLNGSWDWKYGSNVASSDIEGGFEITKGGSDITGTPTGNYIVKLHTNRDPFVIEYVQQ